MQAAIENFLGTTGISKLVASPNWWQYLVMYLIVGVLFYLAIVKKFEPLLLMPIAFGMLLANLPGANLIHLEYFFDDYYVANNAERAALVAAGGHIPMSRIIEEVINHGGLLDILYLGVKLGVYPSLIFLGVGAMTDFSPLIANPKSLLMGAGAQLGVFAAFFFALFIGFSPAEAGALGIIGGADDPTAILVTKELAPQLLGAIAIDCNWDMEILEEVTFLIA